MKNQKGFTLLEVLFVVVIFTLLGLTATKLLNLGLERSHKQNHHYDGIYSARWALHWISMDIRKGRDFIIQKNRIQCQVFHPSRGWESVDYYLDNKETIQRRHRSDAKPLASGIEALEIRKLPSLDESSAYSPILITIRQKKNYQGDYVEFYNEVIPLKNLK
ncbi:prepilin-type N-terminal cleavage/methylation domain-containing protein [Heliorestis acidaminivorans]|uniref:Prepilin-type N-terminal cleavage/methylation domain-containing protein n=1 Tax=Heliorestis acidaminivorans TaxID=553427 RepID=A0A6I0F2E9_9FIRM|nr:prepilin-type N-terminal cleavage/methylation domain-containing protein [Heliorestis acidaminivorans]KAB2952643.1 prepilin-type N-terminal cleavage/methylation domain-containing protein [Heliorestis acidaminivorans]